MRSFSGCPALRHLLALAWLLAVAMLAEEAAVPPPPTADELAVAEAARFLVARDWVPAAEQARALTDLCRRLQPIREPHWSRALAVGGRERLGRLAAPAPEAERYIRPATDHSTEAGDAVCILNPPPSLRLRLWQAITDRARP